MIAKIQPMLDNIIANLALKPLRNQVETNNVHPGRSHI
jgi:hypothetical protein